MRISDTNSTNLAPNPPFYLFRPQDQDIRTEYEKYQSITNISPTSVGGITTGRDEFVINLDEKILRNKISDFRSNSNSDDAIATRYGLQNSTSWNITSARKRLQQDTQWESNYFRCVHRAFDTRYIFYNEAVVDRSRRQVMRNLLQVNLGLVLPRQTKEEWSSLIVKSLCTHKIVTVYDRSFLFPLWIYPTEAEAAMGMVREANLAPAFVAEVKERIGKTPTPEDIFSYAYAVFHAPTYRTRYAAFLKTDFPRLPLPPDTVTFHRLAVLGAKLTALHLLEAPELQAHGITFPVGGDHTVKKMKTALRYVPATLNGRPGRVKLNDDEYFENVPPEAWEFRVGGYQPAAKWLEDRAGRALTEEDITHYRRMIAAMRETTALLPQVDAAFLLLLGKNTEHLAEVPNRE